MLALSRTLAAELAEDDSSSSSSSSCELLALRSALRVARAGLRQIAEARALQLDESWQPDFMGGFQKALELGSRTAVVSFGIDVGDNGTDSDYYLTVSLTNPLRPSEPLEGRSWVFRPIERRGTTAPSPDKVFFGKPVCSCDYDPLAPLPPMLLNAVNRSFFGRRR